MPKTKNVTPDMVSLFLLQTACFFWLIYIPHNSAHKLHSIDATKHSLSHYCHYHYYIYTEPTHFSESQKKDMR